MPNPGKYVFDLSSAAEIQLKIEFLFWRKETMKIDSVYFWNNYLFICTFWCHLNFSFTIFLLCSDYWFFSHIFRCFSSNCGTNNDIQKTSCTMTFFKKNDYVSKVGIWYILVMLENYRIIGIASNYHIYNFFAFFSLKTFFVCVWILKSFSDDRSVNFFDFSLSRLMKSTIFFLYMVYFTQKETKGQ